jgi:hypothetical protein
MRSMLRNAFSLLTLLALTGCSPPATDCAKVARWIELGIQTRTLSPDGTNDANYASAIEERKLVKEKMSEHDLRFAETFQKQLNDPGKDSYAPIYAICRKWESGAY